jgi:hypothetical protein
MGVVLDVAGTDMRSGVEVEGGEEMPPLPWELPWAFSLGLLSFEISRMLFREPAGTKVMIAVRRSGCRTRSTFGHLCGGNRAAEQPLCRCPMAERPMASYKALTTTFDYVAGQRTRETGRLQGGLEIDGHASSPACSPEKG